MRARVRRTCSPEAPRSLRSAAASKHAHVAAGRENRENGVSGSAFLGAIAREAHRRCRLAAAALNAAREQSARRLRRRVIRPRPRCYGVAGRRDRGGSCSSEARAAARPRLRAQTGPAAARAAEAWRPANDRGAKADVGGKGHGKQSKSVGHLARSIGARARLIDQTNSSDRRLPPRLLARQYPRVHSNGSRSIDRSIAGAEQGPARSIKQHERRSRLRDES